MRKRLRSLRFQLSALRALQAPIAAVIGRRLTAGKAHPAWSFSYEVAVEVTRRFMQAGVDAVRAGKPLPEAAGLSRGSPPGMRVALSEETLAGRPTEVHTPSGHAASGATVLYWHGGGYYSCSPRTHRDLIAAIAHASGARCVVPSYPLAPAQPFPASLDTAVACYRALLASGVSPQQLVVSGDSAGGGLTLALLLTLRDAGDALPRAVVLLSPWVDLEVTGASIHAHARYDYLSPDLVEQASRWYAGAESRRHPLISPIHADLRGLPPMFVLTGGIELFRSENELFVERLRAAGVQVTHEIAEHAVHVYAVFGSVSEESRQATRRIGEFVREQAGSP
jgi:monoterpene epsilon-lactone hydrolase